MSAVQRARKKPVEIEFMDWAGTMKGVTEVIQWVLDNGGIARFVGEGEDHPLRRPNEYWNAGLTGERFVKSFAKSFIVIQTLEGDMRMDWDDKLIRGVAGEFYPCKPDIFLATYDVIEYDAGESQSTGGEHRG